MNNDGAHKASYMAPSIDGQVEVITDAQRRAGVDPDTIGYVEAHGTATPLGDPIEVAALSRAFRQEAGDPSGRWHSARSRATSATPTQPPASPASSRRSWH